MDRERIIINFNILYQSGRQKNVDLEVPLSITANELVIGLNTAYGLGINTDDNKKLYLKAENPIALLKGSKTLRDFHLMNGTKIYFVEGEN